MKKFEDIKEPIIRDIYKFGFEYQEVESLDKEINKHNLKRNRDYIYRVYNDLQHNLKEMEAFLPEYEEAYNDRMNIISELETIKAIRIRRVYGIDVKRYLVDVCVVDYQSGKEIEKFLNMPFTLERKEIKDKIKELHKEYAVENIIFDYAEMDDSSYLRLLTKEISKSFTAYTSYGNTLKRIS